MRKVVAIAFTLLFGNLMNLYAQEQIGLRTENYSGVHSIFLNPSATVSVPFSWDVNLLGAGVFFDNNYAFIEKAGVLPLLRQENATFFSANEISAENQPGVNDFIVDYFTDKRKRKVNLTGVVHGPAAMLRFDAHTVGAFYNYRFGLTTPNIPNSLSFYDYYDKNFFEDIFLTPFDGGLMVWDEIGLNYAYRFETNEGFLSIAANLKYLRGKEAAYIQSPNNFDFIKIGEDSLATESAVLNYGLTTTSLQAESFENENVGKGFGIDIGATATFGGYQDEGYDWKLGVSLLDLGYINFTENAQSHQADINSFTDITGSDFDTVQGVADYNLLLQVFSEEVTGSPTGTLQGNSFKMFLPSAISVQVDRSFNEHFYLNAMLTQSIRFGNVGLARANTLAITPRYEHRWLSAQIPFVLHDYRDLRVGFALRLAFLTLGTDNLGSIFLKEKRFTGSDIYFGLRINPFSVGANDRQVGIQQKKLSKKKVKCYF